MNQDNNSKIINFINKNKSAIVFWIVILLTLPFIIFFMVFSISDLTTVSNMGLFGSYLSGMTGFITIIMTSISVIILYYTLRITIKNNNSQIKYSSEQQTISNINLLISLYANNAKKYSDLIHDYTSGLLKPEPDFNFNQLYGEEIIYSIDYYKQSNPEEFLVKNPREYQLKLAKFLLKNRSYIKTLDLKNNANDKINYINYILDIIENTKIKPYLIKYLDITSDTIVEIARIIKNNNNSLDFKKTLILILNSQIDNDSIFWSIVHSDTARADKVYNIDMLCDVPRSLSTALDLYEAY